MNALAQIETAVTGGETQAMRLRHDRFSIPLAPAGPLRFYRDYLMVPHSRGELLRSKLARAVPGERSWTGETEFPVVLLSDALQREGLTEGPIEAITLGDYAHSARGKGIAFLFEGAATRPRIIAKISRDPAHARQLDHELQVLGDLHGRLADDLRAAIPAPIARITAGSIGVCCQAALGGRAMYVETRTSLAPARLIDRHFALAGDWLARFQLASPNGAVPLGQSGAIAALKQLRGSALPLSAGARGYIADLLRQTEAMAGLPLPLAACHGDFWARNLLVDGPQLGVIDWDGYRASSLVFEDLFHFVVSYGQGFAWNLGRWAEPVAAFRATFARSGPMEYAVKTALRTHSSRHSVPPEALGVLFPAFLAERALTRGEFWPRLFEEFAGMDRCACFGS
ncbi:MAG: phosphotransferase [Novosphingobium sp.]